ncbi:Protein of unknown function DUF2057 [Dickeya parazeae Ech586]|uniref:UPF0319 protein Dd586_2992 n=1 Tax=Dickeya zeae (strain Ech586) TaxID=590409 RepID=D2BTJ6_DICZ5|nr:DUF2057 family protein [Dickeya parazeae]ACZ77827.1 Protein of unknown function DUF2057 [Dickeya parazeae Ech586]
MKTISAIAATLWLITFSSLAMATTLKLRPDIELVMVDGKKVPGSLINGADSLELEKGYHQIVFQVLKSVGPSVGTKQTYRSPGLIAVFDARTLSEVAIRLPALDDPAARQSFSQSPDYQLVDSKNLPIPIRTDVLPTGNAELSGEIEKRMADYNRSGQPAAAIAFAPLPSAKASTTPNAAANPLDPLSIMQYWFQQADKNTRQRFLEWARDRESQ